MAASADPDGPDDHDEAFAETATVAAATTRDVAATPVVADALTADAQGEPNCDRLIGLDSWYVSSSASIAAENRMSVNPPELTPAESYSPLSRNRQESDECHPSGPNPR